MGSWEIKKEIRYIIRRMDNVVRGLANGLTLGLADNLSAKMNEKLGHGDYERNLYGELQRDASGGIEYIGGEALGAFVATKGMAVDRIAAHSVVQSVPEVMNKVGRGIVEDIVEDARVRGINGLELENLRKMMINEGDIIAAKVSGKMQDIFGAIEGMSDGIIGGFVGGSMKHLKEHVEQNINADAIPDNIRKRNEPNQR
jgi:hypothetical protein